MDLPSPTPALPSPALSPSFQLRSPTNCFSSDITCCYHGGSCCGKTELFDLHPVAPDLRQNVEGSHSVTTGLSGVLWVPTQTEVLGHDVVGMETLWLRRENPWEGGAEAGHLDGDANNSCLASPSNNPNSTQTGPVFPPHPAPSSHWLATTNSITCSGLQRHLMGRNNILKVYEHKLWKQSCCIQILALLLTSSLGSS